MLPPLPRASTAAIARRLKQARRNADMTQLALAQKLGANQSTVAYWENGRSEPDSARVQQLAQILNVTPEWLSFGQGGVAEPSVVFAHDSSKIPVSRDLPIRGLAQASIHAALSLSDTPIAYAERPPQLAGNNQAFAVWVAGQSMVPRYRPGEIVFVDPNKPLTPGCSVVLVLSDNTAFIKDYVGENRHSATVRQYNPARTMDIDRKKISGIYRIVGSLED